MELTDKGVYTKLYSPAGRSRAGITSASEVFVIHLCLSLWSRDWAELII